MALAYCTSGENNSELIELFSINKVSLIVRTQQDVKF
jgi:hypothetical protein